MLIERPLASLPPDRAAQFLRSLFGDEAAKLAPGDPLLQTLGIQQVAASWQDAGGAAAFRPLALFSVRPLPLDEHDLDHRISDHLEHAGIDVLKTALLSIAHDAQAAGHDQLFVYTPHHRLRIELGRAVAEAA